MDKLSLLPEPKVHEIRRNIRKGAGDLEQKWTNALHLVHKAYEVSQVERPTPAMKDGWKQYESMIEYAVEQLALNRGINGDWRVSKNS